METSGECRELRRLLDKLLQIIQATACTGLRIDQRTRHQIGEDPQGIGVDDVEAVGAQEVLDLGEDELARTVSADVPVLNRHCEQGRGLVEVSGKRTRENRRIPARDDGTDMAAGPQDRDHGGDRLTGIVDIFENAVTQDEIDRPGPHVFGEISCVPENSGDGSVNTLLDRTAVERGERIWARIDDRDPMAGKGEADSVAAGSSAEVENVERHGASTGQGDRVDDGLPHNFCAYGAHGRNCATQRAAVTP